MIIETNIEDKANNNLRRTILETPFINEIEACFKLVQTLPTIMANDEQGWLKQANKTVLNELMSWKNKDNTKV